MVGQLGAWSVVRGGCLVATWATLAVGVALVASWVRSGGLVAFGPEDEQMGAAHARMQCERSRAATSFTVAGVVVHTVLGILTGALATYALLRAEDRAAGYPLVLVAVSTTTVPGAVMWRRRRRGTRPAMVDHPEWTRAEDRLSRTALCAHGVAAAAMALVLVLLALGDR